MGHMTLKSVGQSGKNANVVVVGTEGLKLFQGGVRLASATTISQLLTMGDFQLRINDIRHEIQLPDDQIARLLLVNEDNEVNILIIS